MLHALTLSIFKPIAKNMGIGKYFIIAFTCTIVSGIDVHAESKMLEIISETAEPSADCVIKKLNEKKDKARKEIGIGEVVTLKLTCQGGRPLDKDTKVTWTKKGKGAMLRSRGITATLTADLIMENNDVTVKAEADDFPPAEVTFSIKKPTHLTGKKGEQYSNQSDMAFGVTGTIIITVHPTSVSFSKCGIIEKDGGTIIDPNARPPFNVNDHDPGNNGNPPNARNEIFDQVTLVIFFNTISHLNGTCRWAWLCNYEVTQIKKRIKQIQQIFTVTRTQAPNSPSRKNCSGSVTKLGVPFSVKAVEQTL